MAGVSTSSHQCTTDVNPTDGRTTSSWGATISEIQPSRVFLFSCCTPRTTGARRHGLEFSSTYGLFVVIATAHHDGTSCSCSLDGAHYFIPVRFSHGQSDAVIQRKCTLGHFFHENLHLKSSLKAKIFARTR